MLSYEGIKFLLTLCKIAQKSYGNLSIAHIEPFEKDNVQGFIIIIRVGDKLKIIVYFDGTNELADILNNINIFQQRLVTLYQNAAKFTWLKVKVHTGFYDAYLLVRDFLRIRIPELLAEYDVEKIVVMGHSFGAAIATLFALDFQYNFPQFTDLIEVVLFGSPRVGNKSFARSFNARIEKCLRVSSLKDHSLEAHEQSLEKLLASLA